MLDNCFPVNDTDSMSVLFSRIVLKIYKNITYRLVNKKELYNILQTHLVNVKICISPYTNVKKQPTT